MKAERFDEFHRFGCHFYGNLVVVDYQDDMKADKQWGTFAAGLSLDYYAKAKKLIEERQYKVVRELLGMPILVVEIE